jgi:hypothetical protein
MHLTNETHWFILDLGSSVEVSAVRGRSNTSNNPYDVNIYVSDTVGSWGAAVATGISSWELTTSWQEEATTPKTGRYIMVEVVETGNHIAGPRADHRIDWGWTNKTVSCFDVYAEAGSPPSKASNPSPANETEIDGCFDNKLSWSGDGDDYDVYIGTSAGTLSLIASGTTDNPYTVSEEDFPTNSAVYWRIDSNNDAGTTEGDVWYFDPSPGIATNPTPSDGRGRVSTTQSRLYWDGGKLYQTFDVYVNGELVEEDTTNEYYDLNTYAYWPLSGSTYYAWSVTAKNVHGETVGDVWGFTTGFKYSPAEPRPLDYDEDAGWDVPNGEWAPIGDLDVAGGGSLQSQIVVIGHKVIYFGSL